MLNKWWNEFLNKNWKWIVGFLVDNVSLLILIWIEKGVIIWVYSEIVYKI